MWMGIWPIAGLNVAQEVLAMAKNERALEGICFTLIFPLKILYFVCNVNIEKNLSLMVPFS